LRVDQQVYESREVDGFDGERNGTMIEIETVLRAGTPVTP
jgi:hypothetical protein